MRKKNIYPSAAPYSNAESNLIKKKNLCKKNEPGPFSHIRIWGRIHFFGNRREKKSLNDIKPAFRQAASCP